MHDIDDFKSLVSQSQGLAKSNLFLVQLPSIKREDGSTVLSGIDLSVLCKASQLPGRQLLTHTRQIGLEHSHIVHGYGVEDVNLTFHVMNDYKVKEYFELWQNLAVDNNTKDVGYFNDYAKNVTIKQLKKGLSLPIYKKNLGFLDKVPSNIKNRLPDIEIPGIGGIDLSQGEIDIGLVTNDQVMYECKLVGAFPTSITSIDLADANANGLVEISVGLSYTNWINVKLDEQAGLAGTLARIGTFLDKFGIKNTSGIF